MRNRKATGQSSTIARGFAKLPATRRMQSSRPRGLRRNGIELPDVVRSQKLYSIQGGIMDDRVTQITRRVTERRRASTTRPSREHFSERILYLRVFPANSNNDLTGIRSSFAICSIVSNEGALIPRSIKLRKSTEILTCSANCSWVRLRSMRMERSRCPKSFLSDGIGVAIYSKLP